MRGKFLLLILVLLSFFSVVAQDKLRFNEVNAKDGIQTTVLTMLQDSQGFIWIGTQYGLSRYDGYNIITFRHDSNNDLSISSNYIISLFEDSRGILWVATLNGLNAFDRKDHTFTRYFHDKNNPSSISNNLIADIVEDSNGMIWVATSGGGLNRFNPTTETFEGNFLRDNYSESPLFITHVLIDDEGKLWVTTGKARIRPSDESGKIYRMDPDSLEFSQILPIVDGEIVDLPSVTAIFQDNKKNMWFGTLASGLIKRDRTSGMYIRYLEPENNIEDLITAITQDHLGRLWIATQYSGLYKLDQEKNKYQNYSLNQPETSNIDDDDIVSLLIDFTGVLWVGTWTEGIKKVDFDALQFHKYLQRAGEYHSARQNILDINQDSKGRIWLAGWESGLLQLDLETDKSIRPPALTEEIVGLVRHIFIDDNDKLWLGSNEKGLIYFDPDSHLVKSYRQDFDNDYSISNDTVTNIVQDSSKNLWIATRGGGLNYFDVKQERFSHYIHASNDASSINDDRISPLLYDSKGMIWLGTNEGLDIFDPNKKQVVAHFFGGSGSKNLLGKDVNCIFQDSLGTIWVGTEKGLSRVNQPDENSYSNIDFTSDLGFDKSLLGSIGGIQEDGNGNLWLSSFQYISRYNPKTQSIKNYNSSSNILEGGYYIGSSHKDHSGDIYFGGLNGLTTFSTDKKHKVTNPQMAKITKLLLFNEQVTATDLDNGVLTTSIETTEKLDFDYKQNVFSLEFSALHYSSPKTNQYAYKLIGFDDEWIFTDSSNRRATYTNLDAGEYEFLIKVSSNEGIWTESMHKIKINVQAAPWKTGLAYSIYFIIISSIVGSFIWLRLKQIQAIKLRNEQLSLTSKIFENTSECVWLLDDDLNYLAINKGFIRVTGYSEKEMLGKKLTIAPINGQDSTLIDEIFTIIRSGGRWEGELWEKRKNGKIYPIEIVIDRIVIDDYRGGVYKNQFVGIFSDITIRKKTEEDMRNMAYFDKLTQLPNRAYFHKLVNEEISEISEKENLLILYFDLDDFKNINDSLGHSYGDQLLLIISERLKEYSCDSYTIARLGGDEFAIMVPKAQILQPICKFTNRIAADVLTIVRQQVNIKKHSLHISASIGASIYPDDGDDYEKLLRSADTAMYESKTNGKNQFTLYSSRMNKVARKRLMLEDELNKAIQSFEITPFYQPKVSLKTGELQGLEILARWKHKKLGWVPPNEFIPIAEESRIINRISDQLLTQACHCILPFIDNKTFDGRMSFNLSMSQFLQGDIVSRIDSILKTCNFPSHRLEIEITESMVMKNIDTAIDKMEQFQLRDITIAIDDFGTGYSSLSHLKKFPINTLKIDASFITDLLNSNEDKNIVVSIIQLAHNLGLEVVAEGGETIEQVEVLKQLGCEYLQGYYYSRAISGDQFCSFLGQNKNIFEIV